MSENETLPSFEQLGLAEPILRALNDVGYETPSPIQAAAIPPLLEGRDLLGQAQTGTGKTAAFALPLISRLNASDTATQVLVLAPTRELAIQVAEACQSYAKYLPDFHVLPIYGGSSYDTQLRALKRGAQVVVGTPGRVMDMMRRGKLDLSALRALVLDEADEMLRMGFIDDVEWIIEQCPFDRQIALFSATMPDVIRRVAHRHLQEPKEVKIAAKTSTASTVRQRYWMVSGLHKLDAMTRLLEVEPYDALLAFVRTKTAAEELATKLAARGHACEALHGDIPQKLRERTVEKLKGGQLDILVATDVVARGLDVERITHVVNYDIPYDTESYVHRIGRTGRAGRSGDAILFVAPRERRMLRAIEHTTRQPIEPMHMPTAQDINRHRMEQFKQQIRDTLLSDDLEQYQEVVAEFLQDDTTDPLDLCAALAKMVKGDEPLFMDESQPEPAQRNMDDRRDRNSERGFERDDRHERRERKQPSTGPRPLKDHPEVSTVRYRVEVGYEHGVKPGQIVGAIANEADIDSSYIGHIEIFDTCTTVDLPEGMPEEVMDVLKKARVCGRPLEISVFTGELPQRSERRGKPFGGKPFGGDSRGRGDGRGRGEGRERPFGNDRGDFKRGPRKFDKGGRNDR
ncbi:DEAD/DEAH box helicase [Pseudaeromonas paramecii]|uniref:ATP-dependent RNA helicase DeaD n=1 Tax=Pseudaeromonas paramecii TaxID=2138166 RepID=A0ABP8Q197_9GAMM